MWKFNAHNASCTVWCMSFRYIGAGWICPIAVSEYGPDILSMTVRNNLTMPYQAAIALVWSSNLIAADQCEAAAKVQLNGVKQHPDWTWWAWSNSLIAADFLCSSILTVADFREAAARFRLIGFKQLPHCSWLVWRSSNIEADLCEYVARFGPRWKHTTRFLFYKLPVLCHQSEIWLMSVNL